jgi:hypothetical protein
MARDNATGGASTRNNSWLSETDEESYGTATRTSDDLSSTYVSNALKEDSFTKERTRPRVLSRATTMSSFRTVLGLKQPALPVPSALPRPASEPAAPRGLEA